MDTKERILLNALRLFARDGYEAVSVSSIAAELGITKGALYRHYQSKRDIFDHILARMEQRDAERAGEFGVPEGTKDEMEEKYKNTAVAALIGYSKAQFEYWTGMSLRRISGACSPLSNTGTRRWPRFISSIFARGLRATLRIYSRRWDMMRQWNARCGCMRRCICCTACMTRRRTSKR